MTGLVRSDSDGIAKQYFAKRHKSVFGAVGRDKTTSNREGKQKRLAKEQVVLGPDSKAKSALV